jgi:hypothetical protein
MPSAREMSTTFVLTGAVVVALAFVAAVLADTPTWAKFFQILAISAVVLLAFVGLGAVFGKTLGDFLRNPGG